MSGVLTSIENFGNSLLAPLTDPFAVIATPTPSSATPTVVPVKTTSDSKHGAKTTPTSIITSNPPETTSSASISSQDSDTKTSTSSTESSDTSSSIDITSTSDVFSTQTSQTTLSTSVLSTSVPPPPAPINPTSSNAASQSTASPSSSNGVSTAGIVVGSIIGFAMIATTMYLVFRFCPPVRRWWEARREAGREDRTYREFLDGPRSSGESYAKEREILPYAHTHEEKAAARRKFIEKVRHSRVSKSSDSGAGLGLGPVTPIRAHPDFNDTPRTRSQTSFEHLPPPQKDSGPTTGQVVTMVERKPCPPPKDELLPPAPSPVSPMGSEPSTMTRVSQIGLALSSPSEVPTTPYDSASFQQRQQKQQQQQQEQQKVKRAHARFSFEPE